jgi:hypothetical protein
MSAMMYAAYWTAYAYLTATFYERIMECLENAMDYFLWAGILYPIPFACLASAALSVGGFSEFSAVLQLEQAMHEFLIETYETQRGIYEDIRGVMDEALGEAAGAGHAIAEANIGTKSTNWTDGQGRLHRVDIGVDTGSMDPYYMFRSNETMEYIREKHEEFEDVHDLATLLFTIGVILGGIGCAIMICAILDECCFWLSCIAVFIIGFVIALIGAALILITRVWANDTLQGLLKDMMWAARFDGEIYVSTGGTGDYILVAVHDVGHPRTVGCGSTQHHDGADLGLWQSQYPDISGGATATFANSVDYILDEGGEGYTDHWPSLIAAN